jgi:site-specific recombinase XerD
MNISDLVAHYLSFRRTLGERCRTYEVILRSFCRAVGPQTPVTDIRRDTVTAFLAVTGSVTSAWHIKYYALRGLFRFAVSRGHLDEAPLPTGLPKRAAAFVPYIYSREELRRLLEAIPSYRRYRSRIEPPTLRALLLLLYGAGLRAREALRLAVTDVDLSDGLLTIRATKFFKSRLVPVGRQLARVLADYARWRAVAHPAGDGGSPLFFVGKRGTGVHLGTLEGAFRRLRKHAGVVRSDGARYQPRLHDLRHTFAVHRLTSWYRQGADVQRLLPHLCVYLGHVRLAATQVYLTMTPELLQQANGRFERYARGEENHA